MKTILIIFVFILGFGMSQATYACDYQLRNNIVFNLNMDFYTVRVDEIAREVPFPAKKYLATIKKTGDRVFVRFGMMTLSGRLFKIFQCENSPKFVVWDSDNFNPIARGQYAHNQFWAYANTSRPPILSLTKNNVTVLADSETLKAMSQSQVYLIKNDLGITLNTALGQVNLEGMRKEFDYVSINLVRGFGLNFIQMIWHSKDGRMFATNLDLNTKQISVAN